ncbi:MAG: hypothetical protein JO023_03335 [Chloroflexi bacterium]|nr:hypothetical protein [Chloroflexota bacterium]
MASGASATPSIPPPYRRRRGGTIIPLVLILIGVLLLLQNLGLVSADIWSAIGRLWPLLLVLIGLEVLLGRHLGGQRILGIMLLAFAGAGIWAAVTAGSSTGETDTRTLDRSLDGATSANVLVNFGAGQLKLGSLSSSDPTQLASLTLRGPANVEPTTRYEVQNGIGQLQYGVTGRSGLAAAAFPMFDGRQSPPAELGIALSPNIPLTVSVRTGAADAQLDFSQLRATDLNVSVGASAAHVTLPANAGTTTAHVQGGLTALTIVVPAGVGAQVHYRGGLNALDMDRTRFSAVGNGEYRSADYDSASNRVDLYVDSGLASVTIE